MSFCSAPNEKSISAERFFNLSRTIFRSQEIFVWGGGTMKIIYM
ncbi:hypothetical protein HMPREF9441_03351 [Paraprevotella clara YIT 11840]|uniref:Uncharacterized protein n=1 Tax=Paraprevotella clara YIT 11840 TaxID=762968 RepID=G5SVH7_9BACT|nr:hypothetical protein HMPREF9441_03351 [Paraprevotella clara YIT 11840]